MSKIIIPIFIIVFLVGLIGAGFYFFMNRNNYLANNDNILRSDQSYEAKKYEINEIYQKVILECSDKSQDCLQKSIENITKTYGPAASLETIKLLFESGFLEKTADDHEIAHVVGKDTAKYWGINGQSFLFCPTSFNYGCQHGFFQYAMIRVTPPKKAVDLICGSLGNEYSTKFKFYCYHGVGHGVMDAMSYDLKDSLDICDTLGSTGADGCWQGVFMENVNAGMRGEAKKNAFSKTDPLVPCNQVDDKYRHECYINHAGWLMNFFGDIDKAINACLGAGNYINICLQSLGLMATNPVWQPALVENFDIKRDTTKVAKEICLKFPEAHREQCIVAGVDNILNFDEFDTKRAQNFCDIVEENFKSSCYYHIGLSLKSQATDIKIVLQKCAAFGGDLEKACLSGAGL